MNKLRAIIVLAVTANILTVVLYKYAVIRTAHDNDAFFYIALVIIGLWLITFLMALDQARRKNLFSEKSCLWSILIIQFCTPFPMLVACSTVNPQILTTQHNTDIVKADKNHHPFSPEKGYVAYKLHDNTHHVTHVSRVVVTK
ncbi:MAG: hypothetical protein ABI203_10025 [Mucilaginibacter sp.]